jgi:exonuclease SbcC
MAVLSNMFSGKENNSLDEKQLQALTDKQRLELIAQTQDSAFIKTLMSGVESLDELISLTTHPDIPLAHKAARQELAHRVDLQQIPFEQIKRQIDDLISLAEIAGYCRDKSIPKLLLAQIDNQQQLSDLAENGGTSHIRKLAAERLTTTELLESLIKKTRGRDKTVYRICKENLDQLKHEQAEKQQQQQQVVDLVEQFEKHAETSPSPLYKAKLQHLQEQWHQVEERAPSEYLQRVNNAVDQVMQKLTDQKSEVSRSAPGKLDHQHSSANNDKTTDASTEQRQQICNQLTAQLAQLIDQPKLTHERLTEAQHQLAQLQQQWQQTGQRQDKQETRHFSHLCTEFEHTLDQLEGLDSFSTLVNQARQANDDARETLDQIVHHLDIIPEQQTPKALKDARQLLNQSDHKHASGHSHQQTIQQMRGLIRKAGWAVQQGHLRQASGIMNSLDEKKSLLNYLPRFIEKQLHALQLDLERLRDWQSFAVEPKKRELIQRMEDLIGSNDHPDHLAKTIRKLQDEWKELSRGGKDQHQALWEAFHQAAQRAYQPCKLFFREQSQFRKENLKKRKLLLEQLQLLLDQLTDDSDWKALDQAQHLARKEWRLYSPVERAANKPLQAEFEVLLNQIQERLEVHYQHSKDIKAHLIDDASQLLELDNPVDATEKAKVLQRQWKDAGRTWRQDEQALWKEFRAICDQLFDRRDQEQKEKHQHEQDQVDQVMQLCEQAETLGEQQQINIEQTNKQLTALTRDYQSLNDLPRERQKELQSRWHKARLKVKKRLEKEQRSQELEHWNLADQLAQQIFDQELDDEQRQQINNLIIPESTRQSLLNNANGQPDENSDLSYLCIQLELMAGIEGPEEEKDKRMTLQVERLQHRLMQHEDQRDMFEQIMQQWYGQNQDRSPWLERFQNARSTWLDKQG